MNVPKIPCQWNKRPLFRNFFVDTDIHERLKSGGHFSVEQCIGHNNSLLTTVAPKRTLDHFEHNSTPSIPMTKIAYIFLSQSSKQDLKWQWLSSILFPLSFVLKSADTNIPTTLDLDTGVIYIDLSNNYYCWKIVIRIYRI